MSILKARPKVSRAYGSICPRDKIRRVVRISVRRRQVKRRGDIGDIVQNIVGMQCQGSRAGFLRVRHSYFVTNFFVTGSIARIQ